MGGLFFLPLPRSDVSARILCRLLQMRTSAVSEDSASCARRVARPQPRGFSVGQQSDGQYHSSARRNGLLQVSLHAFFFKSFFMRAAAFLDIPEVVRHCCS